MQKILFILFLSIATYAGTFAQTPVVIKQDSTVQDLDEEEEVDVRDLPFRERIRFGGGIGGLQFGSPTVIAVSPMAGYQVTNDLTVGLAVDYQYYKYRNSAAQNQYGPRVFGQYRLHFLDVIASNMFLQAELQKYYFTQGAIANQPSISNEYKLQTLAGIGAGFGGLQFTVLYNLTYDDTISPITGFRNSPYGSPWVIRIGGFFF
ncbi:hypothetical protein [Arcicella rigui]|uniref:DUF3575 domain-containing protein n=1 Tax=Arcicella rigui TaxID=797020 RepID=A0ABU5QBZ4_9BACT|nr:hypothetical protein [Arcicella rigui]MEA5140374.1 hypothetical protein [Arcicella rigui]